MRDLCSVVMMVLVAVTFVTPVAAQQQTIVGTEIKSKENAALKTYWQNREAARESEKRLKAPIEELAENERELQKQLANIAQQLAGLRAAPGADSGEKTFPVLRTTTNVIEGITTKLFYPALGLTNTLASVFDSLGLGDGGRVHGAIRTTVSYLFPVVFILGALFMRRYHKDIYQRRRRLILSLAVAIALILPLSVNAEEAPEPTLDSLLSETESVLALTPAQKYLRDLEELGNENRRYQIKNLGLSGGHFEIYPVFNLGTGEHIITMAALYEADNQPEMVVEQLQKLSQDNIRFTDKQNAGPIIYTAVSALLTMEKNQLAAELYSASGSWINSTDQLLALHNMFYARSMSVSASAVANQAIELTSQSPGLLVIYDRLAERGDNTSATNALLKASKVTRDVEEVSSVLGKSLAANNTEAVQVTLERGATILYEVSQFFRIVDQLLKAQRPEEANAFLDSLIDKVKSSNRITVNGARLSKPQVLGAISTESFERGMYEAAESSASTAVLMLSRTERDTFMMRVPQAQLEKADLPADTDHLAAPLYFGLLKEAMGAPESAETLYARETSSALKKIIDSNGLSVPQMRSHLVLLARRLIESEDFETLAALDRVLVQLERSALDRTQKSLAQVITAKEAVIRNLEQNLEAQKVKLISARQRVATEKPGFLSKAYSAVFLPLRALALLAFVSAFIAAIIAITRQYARQFSMHRFYAHTTKLLESIGWMYIVSILMVPVGVVMVFIGQWLMIRQANWSLPPNTSPQNQSETA